MKLSSVTGRKRIVPSYVTLTLEPQELKYPEWERGEDNMTETGIIACVRRGPWAMGEYQLELTDGRKFFAADYQLFTLFVGMIIKFSLHDEDLLKHTGIDQPKIEKAQKEEK